MDNLHTSKANIQNELENEMKDQKRAMEILNLLRYSFQLTEKNESSLRDELKIIRHKQSVAVVFGE